jgi:Tfp pilus assembly protein PilF
MRVLAIVSFLLAMAIARGGAAQAQPAPDVKQQTEKMFRDARGAYGSADYGKAVKLCDEIIKLDPKHADAYGLRGKAKKDMGDIDSATADLNKAIELNPANGESFYIRGQVQEIMGEMKKAQADYAKACASGFKEACK